MKPALQRQDRLALTSNQILPERDQRAASYFFPSQPFFDDCVIVAKMLTMQMFFEIFKDFPNDKGDFFDAIGFFLTPEAGRSNYAYGPRLVCVGPKG